MKNRAFAIILAMVMALSSFGMVVFADVAVISGIVTENDSYLPWGLGGGVLTIES